MSNKTTVEKLESSFLSSLMVGKAEYVDEMKILISPGDMFLEPNKVLLRVIYSAHDTTSGRNRGTAMILSRASNIQSGNNRTLADDFVDYGIDSAYLDLIESMYVDEVTGRAIAQDIKDSSLRRNLAEFSRKAYAISKSSSPDFRAQAEVAWGDFSGNDNEDMLKDGSAVTENLWNEITGTVVKNTTISLTSMGWLDTHMGIVGGRYYLIAMPPHGGKTIVMKNLIIQAAITSNIVPILFLYEEDPNEAALSFVSMLTGPQSPWVLKGIQEPKDRPTIHKMRIEEMKIDQAIVEKRYAIMRAKGQNIWYKKPTPMEMMELENAKSLVASLSFKAMAAPSSIDEMRSIVRRVARRYPGKHIVPVLDYVQLATSGSDNYREIGTISRNVKQSCLRDGGTDCQVSWFVLSQFNRTHGTSNLKKDVTMGKSPRQMGLTLDALAESPSLGQDPDFIMFGISPSTYVSEAGVAAAGGSDWVQLNYSIMKNRITNQFPDGMIFHNKNNGWVSDDPSFDRI